MAIGAVWNAGPRNAVVTFDMNIQPATLNLANWILTHAGGSANPGSAVIAGATITLGFMAFTGVTQIEYAPPPFDVIGAAPNLQPAAAFTLPL